MTPAWQVVTYVAAIFLFLAAAWGVTGLCRPVNLGWLGVALVTLVLLVGAIEAL